VFSVGADPRLYNEDLRHLCGDMNQEIEIKHLEESDSKYLVMRPRWGSIPRLTD
jgi:hypothetical protein